MPDEYKYNGKRVASRINVTRDHDIRYWTKELKTTPVQLMDAVKAIGTAIEDVRAWLKTH